MKEAMTLQDLAAEVKRVDTVKRDFLGETTFLEARPRVQLEVVGEHAGIEETQHQITPETLDIAIKGVGDQTETFEVNTLAHRQIARKTPIKADYYKHMLEHAPALLATNINHWFRETPAPRLIRTLDGFVRAFLTNAYRPVQNHDLLNAILPALMEIPGGKDLRFESNALTERRMYLKAFIPSREIPIKSARVNDVIRVGFVLGNSEVGCGSVYARPMVMVLSCANGMQFDKYTQRIRHVGRRIQVDDDAAREIYSREALEADDKALVLKTRDMALAAFKEATAEQMTVDILNATNSDPIEGDVPAAIEEVGDRIGGLTQDEQSGIVGYLAAGGDLSKWGVSQAVTRFSQDVESYDRADKLERMGAKVIELPQTQWKSITQAKAA
jgi:hypothetical protein